MLQARTLTLMWGGGSSFPVTFVTEYMYICLGVTSNKAETYTKGFWFVAKFCLKTLKTVYGSLLWRFLFCSCCCFLFVCCLPPIRIRVDLA